MQSLGNVSVCLLQQLSHQQHHGCSSIAADIILCGRSTGNHDSRGVLDLHFAEENVSIFGELDLASTVDKHLDGTRGAKVGL
jgi:hypothetical protein